MIIQYINENSFKFSNKHKSMVYAQCYNKGIAKIKADILGIASCEKQLNIPDKNNAFVISMPGEYEVKGIFVQTFCFFNKDLSFLIKMDNISLCSLEKPHNILSDEQIQSLNNVDILLIPVNKKSKKIIKQIEPCVVIPFGAHQDLKNLAQEFSITPKIITKKFNIKKTDLPDEGMDIIIFSKKTI